MSLTDLLNRRRSVRHYDETPIDADTVRRCLQTAQLAPSSSNMQLYEFYHVTDPAVLKRLAAACLSQRAAETTQQAVVFVTRQDLHRRRAQAVSEFERGNIERNSPPEKHAKRIKASEMYYGRMLPFLYGLRVARRVPRGLGLVYRAVSSGYARFVRKRYAQRCSQKLRLGRANLYAGDGGGRLRHLSAGRVGQPHGQTHPQAAAWCGNQYDSRLRHPQARPRYLGRAFQVAV